MLKKRSEEAAETKPLDENQKPQNPRRSQDSVIIYITILFTVIFLLTLLSYKMHQRESEQTITELTAEHSMSERELRLTIATLRQEKTELENDLNEAYTTEAGLRDQVAGLKENWDEAVQRAAEAENEVARLQEELKTAQEECDTLRQALEEAQEGENPND